MIYNWIFYNSNSILYQSSKTNITNSNILTYDNKSNEAIVFGTQKYYLSKQITFPCIHILGLEVESIFGQLVRLKSLISK